MAVAPPLTQLPRLPVLQNSVFCISLELEAAASPMATTMQAWHVVPLFFIQLAGDPSSSQGSAFRMRALEEAAPPMANRKQAWRLLN